MRALRSLIAITLLTALPTPAQFYPGATEITQIANHAQLVIQLARTIQILKVQIAQFKHMGIQGQLFTAMQWGQFSRDMVQLSRTIRQGKGIIFPMQNLDHAFRQVYPGYLTNGATFDQQYRDWNRVNMDTIEGILSSIGAHSAQLDSDAQTLSMIQSFAGSAVGQNQLLQAGDMLANQQVQGIEKLRQLLMAQVVGMATFQGRQINNEQVQEQVRQDAYGAVRFVPTN